MVGGHLLALQDVGAGRAEEEHVLHGGHTTVGSARIAPLVMMDDDVYPTG